MTQQVGFGGGCHWCTEAVFASLQGVTHLEQGFISSIKPNNTFSEAVRLEFDPQVIPLEVLIEIHLRTHASTSDHSMRKKYRSAIYVFSDEQSIEVKRCIKNLQKDFDKPLVTEVLSFAEFKTSDERFQNYHEKHSERQFCKTYIDPKLALLRKNHGDFLK